MTIHKKCPICNKNVEVTNEAKLDRLIITTYSCGHIRSHAQKVAKDLDITSKDGKHPYKYQLEGASWAIKNGARVLIADEMGVGKTLQSFLVCNSDPEYLPFLIVCKAGLKIQMAKEGYRWCGWLVQIIEDENDPIIPGLPGYIVGYDSLAYSEFVNKRGKVISRGMKDPEAWIKKLGVKTVILDECQSVKNSESKRTRAVQKISKESQYLIALSGTPILNNAGEYFPILNMLHPEKFPNKNAYVMRWCDSYWSSGAGVQKVGGIKDVKGFKEYTKDFIIRRTRAEVLPDLPKVDRRFRFEELGEKVEEAYKKAFQDFQNYYYYGSAGQTAFQKDGNILAYLSKMRHLTGIAKIPGVVDFVEEFLQETDRKIVIFTHHIDVANEVVERIRSFYPNVLQLGVPIDNSKIEKFWTSDYRVLQASTIAGGEGVNLQCCSDCIIMEPEWNPPKELQAEGRFPRPGQESDKITSTSFIAVGTVDEFFAELKAQKQSNFDSTIDGIETKWNEANLIKELAEILASRGGKKWGW